MRAAINRSVVAPEIARVYPKWPQLARMEIIVRKKLLTENPENQYSCRSAWTYPWGYVRLE
jgi:hypothetical protein